MQNLLNVWLNKVLGVAGENERDVVDRLQYFDRQFAELLALLEARHLDRGQRIEARSRLRKLKYELDEEAHSLQDQDRSSRWEQEYLKHVLQQAKANIVIRVGSAPNTKWHDNLSDARHAIVRALEQLQSGDRLTGER